MRFLSGGYGAAAFLVALTELAGCGPQAHDAAEGKLDQVHSMTQGVGLMAKLDALEQQAQGRPLRVIVTVADGIDGNASAMGFVMATLLQAGAYSVDPILGTALLVVEAETEALRAAVRTGLVADLTLDELSPPNQ